MTLVGMDVHWDIAEVALLVDGTLRRLGRVEMPREKPVAFARAKLTIEDHASPR